MFRLNVPVDRPEEWCVLQRKFAMPKEGSSMQSTPGTYLQAEKATSVSLLAELPFVGSYPGPSNFKLV